jgi:hypothetical protein
VELLGLIIISSSKPNRRGSGAKGKRIGDSDFELVGVGQHSTTESENRLFRETWLYSIAKEEFDIIVLKILSQLTKLFKYVIK